MERPLEFLFPFYSSRKHLLPCSEQRATLVALAWGAFPASVKPQHNAETIRSVSPVFVLPHWKMHVCEELLQPTELRFTIRGANVLIHAPGLTLISR